MKKAAKVVRDKICKIEDPAKRIAETARLLAWPASQAKNAYNRAANNYKKAAEQVGTSNLPGNACSGFVSTVLKASGLVSDYHPNKGYNTACINNYFKKSPNWKNIKTLEKSTPRPGDVAVLPKPCGCNCNKKQMGHTLVYIEDKGKIVIAQANYASPRQYGYVTTGRGNYHNNKRFIIYRYVGD